MTTNADKTTLGLGKISRLRSQGLSVKKTTTWTWASYLVNILMLKFEILLTITLEKVIHANWLSFTHMRTSVHTDTQTIPSENFLSIIIKRALLHIPNIFWALILVGSLCQEGREWSCKSSSSSKKQKKKKKLANIQDFKLNSIYLRTLSLENHKQLTLMSITESRIFKMLASSPEEWPQML